MAQYNLWLPGNTFFGFNAGVQTSLIYVETAEKKKLLAQSFSIPNRSAGFGITSDQVTPPFAMTKPPKMFYTSTSDMVMVIKDSLGWNWLAPVPKQTVPAERGWSWELFGLHEVQENSGTLPTAPATGNIQTFQFAGAAKVHGDEDNIPQTLSIVYLSGRSPVVATGGDIRVFTLTNRNADAHIWKVGDVQLMEGERREVKYIGGLPFAYQVGGPRNRLSALPYKGPLVAGYQSGTPWVDQSNNEALGQMLDFMAEAQHQFQQRSPDGILGPWMHIYLQALWDCEQNGVIDTWVWDGPDGNPAWNGWQYRALDAMGRTWFAASRNTEITVANVQKVADITSKFLDWLYYWLIDNPAALGIPNDWRPEGWTQGTPLLPDQGLDPKYTMPQAHDSALALKGAVFAVKSGYNNIKGHYIIHRLIESLRPIQVQDPQNLDYMRGSFTLNPSGYEVYGFEQGEVLEALALCLQHEEVLVSVLAG